VQGRTVELPTAHCPLPKNCPVGRSGADPRYRFSHLYGRTYSNPETSTGSEERKDIPLSAPMQDKVDGRIMRSRQRAMERLRSGEEEKE